MFLCKDNDHLLLKEFLEKCSVDSETRSQQSFALELRRKTFHLLVLGLPVIQIFLPDDSQTRILLIAGGAIFVTGLLGMEAYRLRKPTFFVNRFTRASERDQIAAYIPTSFVVFFIYLTFGLNIATISIIVSALGDAAAALFGIRFGTHQLPFTKKKSWEGTSAGFGVTILVALIYTKIWLALTLALIMVGTDFIEDMKTTFLSDNFLNPFFFAVFLHHFPSLIR